MRESSYSVLRGICARLITLTILWSIELIVISVQLDTTTLQQQQGLTRLLCDWGPDVLQAAITFVALFITLAWFTSRKTLGSTLSEMSQMPVRWDYLAAHGVAMWAFTIFSSL